MMRKAIRPYLLIALTLAAPVSATLAQTSSAASTYAATTAPAADPRKPPAAKPGALTLEQVVEQARAKNPTLLAAELNLRAVRAQELQAGVRANPYLGVAASNVTLANDGSEGNPPAYAVQLSRLFERGNKREYRLENARATTTQTAAQLEDTTRQTILQVKTAFTHMLIAKEALELSRANLTDFRHEVEIANDRYKAGDIGKLDFERLDLQLGAFESDEANAEISLLQSSSQLQTLLGAPTPSPDFDITGDIIPPILTQTQADLTQGALTRRPDYAASRASVLAADANAHLAIANGTTDPTLEAEYDRSGNYNSFGFNVNLPLRLFDKNQGNKQTTRFQADSTRFTEIAARNQVVSDVDQAWVGYTRARALSDRFGKHYLDEAIDVLAIARFAYDHGGLALIDYLDALRDSRSSTNDALNSYSQTWMAIHQLSAAAATELIP
jgi:cobalt-zinc-cadmium efflux system outer membrane protein